MRNVNVFVSNVARPGTDPEATSPLDATSPDKVVITFANGRRAWYASTDPRAAGYRDVLASVQEEDLPVYVEVSDACQVLEVFIPLVASVVSVGQRPSGDAMVQLSPSHSAHTLRKTHPAFEELMSILQAAVASGEPVAVTECPDAAEIRDVRPFADRPFEWAGAAALAALPADQVISTLTEISAADANACFDRIARRGCSAGQVKHPCIPFLFPDDGCHGRAHMMCALLHEQFGIVTGKIWLYGRPDDPYRVATPNHPACSVLWLYHVAPIVRTRRGITVIDPSLFKKPVTAAAWRRKQFRTGTIVLSEQEVFDRIRPDARIQRDSTMSRTRRVLGTFRARLVQRITRERRPPPYC